MLFKAMFGGDGMAQGNAGGIKLGDLLGGMGGGLFGVGGMGGMPAMSGQGGRTGGYNGDRHRPPPPYVILPGTTVVVRNLAKQPEHNGKTGRITRFDESKGRYDVELGEGSAVLALRPQNLTQQCSLEVAGL